LELKPIEKYVANTIQSAMKMLKYFLISIIYFLV